MNFPQGPSTGAHDSIADRIGDMVSAHAPDGTFRYVSAASRNLLGYEPDDLVGTSGHDHIHPEDAEKIVMAHESALSNAPLTVAYRFRGKDGQYVWVETTTTVVNDEESGDVKEIVCSTRALADRRDVEQLSSDEYRQALGRIQTVLDEQGIKPVYQPILDLTDHRVIALEALARFPIYPERRPDRWFAEAWEIGLGIQLELLAVRAAATALTEIPDEIHLSVNASPPTVASDAFLPCFESSDRVTVELTEHLQISNYGAFADAIQPMRDAGGQIAIDDFGAGYASLRHILRLRPEWIKLDISLTERVAEDSLANAMASALSSFAQDVGLNLVAEGIETEEELEALTDLGFRYGQGFYFGVPAPLEEVLDRLS
jgi:PAS domain S-box-containing protein